MNIYTTAGLFYKNNGEDVWSGLFSFYNGKEVANRNFNEAILTLLQRGQPTRYIDRSGNNVLYFYCDQYSKILEGCCRYGWFRKLGESMFLNVIDALLDAGVQADLVNRKGEIPFHAFMRIVRRGNEHRKKIVCSKCCERYIDAKESEVVNLTAQQIRLLKCLDRLSPR